MTNGIYKVETEDGSVHTLTKKAARRSGLMRQFMDIYELDSDHDSDAAMEPMILPMIEANTITWIIFYLEIKKNCPAYDEQRSSKNKEELSREIEWENRTLAISNAILFRIFNASNYLDIPDLYDWCVQKVADKGKGKSVEEMRKVYGVKQPPDEEQARLSMQNPLAAILEYRHKKAQERRLSSTCESTSSSSEAE
ncbi:unnamed protein product, partial [Mesorhabditis belari]|uniref:Skp1-related protein n=1 Tax=Mesorhabditis belari TaxID=2138241 RepID=A0AAF3J5U9_9BILA